MKKICKHCGKEFDTNRGYQVYCSSNCKYQKEKKDKVIKRKQRIVIYGSIPKYIEKEYIKICPICKKTFKTKKSYKTYCSAECYKKHNLIRLKEVYNKEKILKRNTTVNNENQIIKRKCKKCGSTFYVNKSNNNERFCCKDCKNSYSRVIRRYNVDTMLSNLKSKLKYYNLKKQNYIEDVSYDEVYKKDNGRCKICGLYVLPGKINDKNWDGTIDHIVPISKGGLHCLNNCQLTHRICNSIKRQNGPKFKINWDMKSKTNNYWKLKYEIYIKLFNAYQKKMQFITIKNTIINTIYKIKSLMTNLWGLIFNKV